MTNLLTSKQQELLEYLGGSMYNKRVGDFLFIHEGVNPQRITFQDSQKNTVVFGDPSGASEVTILILGSSRGFLEELLFNYLRELVERHGERLHDQGSKQFRNVTIQLPYKLQNEYDLTVTIYTNSSGLYGQSEIAHEVMAALSGVLVYKAVSPMFCHAGFVRCDAIDDDNWVEYRLEKHGVCVMFDPAQGNSHLMVTKKIPQVEDDGKKFK